MNVAYIEAYRNMAALNFNQDKNSKNVKDEEDKGWNIVKSLIKKGYDFIFADDDRFVFEVEDRSEFTRFSKDFEQLEKNYSA